MQNLECTMENPESKYCIYNVKLCPSRHQQRNEAVTIATLNKLYFPSNQPEIRVRKIDDGQNLPPRSGLISIGSILLHDEQRLQPSMERDRQIVTCFSVRGSITPPRSPDEGTRIFHLELPLSISCQPNAANESARARSSTL